MTKDVLISIRGMQFENNLDGDNIEVIQQGHYYRRNGMHYLVYEEPVEGTDKINKNMIKFDEKQMSVTKKGMVNVAMTFCEKEKNLTSYRTPFGNIMIGLDTHDIRLNEGDKKLSLEVSYSLDVNYEFLSDCKIYIEAKELGQSLTL